MGQRKMNHHLLQYSRFERPQKLARTLVVNAIYWLLLASTIGSSSLLYPSNLIHAQPGMEC